MSEENVEVVEAFYVAFDQGDNASLLALLDPDVEWDTTARIDGRVTHGIEDMRASVEEGFSSLLAFASSREKCASPAIR